MSVAETPVRERILEAATRRYYAEGIRAVSADRLIADAGISKVTFYRYFASKDELVVAYLEQASAREQASVTVERTKGDPAAVLRWYADSVGAMSCAPGFRGCPFINAAAEIADPAHPGRRIVSDHRAWLTAQVAELLTEMKVERAESRAEQLMMLRDGAMIAGYLGRSPGEVAASLIAAGRAVIGR